MNIPSRQQRRGELNRQKIERRRAERKLRQRQKAESLTRLPTATISNGKSEWTTIDEEKQARQQAVEEQLRVYRCVLPILLKRFEKIPDPRNPKTITHRSTLLMLYGILAFVFQIASRREANREMTMPQFQENLRLLFPTGQCAAPRYAQPPAGAYSSRSDSGHTDGIDPAVHPQKKVLPLPRLPKHRMSPQRRKVIDARAAFDSSHFVRRGGPLEAGH